MSSEPKPLASKYAPGPDVALYKALSHPLRYRIMLLLAETEASPKELSEVLDEDFHKVCEHVRILRDGAFIELVGKDQRRGGTQHIYKATMRPLFDADEWSLLPQFTRETASASIVRVILRNLIAAIETGVFDAHPRRALLEKPMVVDEQGFADADESALRHLDRLQEIAAESAARMIENGDEGLAIKTATLVHLAAPSDKRGEANP